MIETILGILFLTIPDYSCWTLCLSRLDQDPPTKKGGIPVPPAPQHTKAPDSPEKL